MTGSQTTNASRDVEITSIQKLSELSDIEAAQYTKDTSELLIFGPAATANHALRGDDWLSVMRAVASSEAPGVTIDPGESPDLMTVRYFAGVEGSHFGNVLFEADRALKILATGFDNTTCRPWPLRPSTLPTELDRISTDSSQSSTSHDGEWHRFWIEQVEVPGEKEDIEGVSNLWVDTNRLAVNEETIPPGIEPRPSARAFAASLTDRFLELTEVIPVFAELQRAAGMVVVAKWIRDEGFPVDREWIEGAFPPFDTPKVTPTITVIRAKLSDQYYLSYGIHGGVDFQRENSYNPMRVEGKTLIAAGLREKSDVQSWGFQFNQRQYRAVRLKIADPVYLTRRWNTRSYYTTTRFPQTTYYRYEFPTTTLSISNRTSGPLWIELKGPTEQSIAVTGDQVITVIPGLYKISASTPSCGSKEDTVSVYLSLRNSLDYYCGPGSSLSRSAPTPQPVPRPRPQPEPRPTSTGAYIIVNNTGADITVTIRGTMTQNYTAAPGTSSITLESGTYSVTLSTRCGVGTESLNIERGSRYTGTYGCVTRYR
jgi:hypothetical protein